MEKPTKVFLVGASFAALLFAGGKAHTLYLETKLDDLLSKCVAESARESKAGTLKFELVCDPKDLSRSRSDKNPLVGVQAELAKVQGQLSDSGEWPLLIALFVVVVSALPWAWYFLLRRIRELRDTIVGR